MSAPSYISRDTLASMLRSSNPPVVIDVREDDRIGGHIKSSVHIPAPDLRRDPSLYLKHVKGKDTVVFHCMYSQLRGPTCAVRFWYALDKARKDGRLQSVPEVVILEGGFAQFIKAGKAHDDLIEAFDPRYHSSP
ncbi:Dual specificity phosphatase Cdc25 [Gracilariopsis chorda]|uniref:Dual specificity phosphatase Cdc25 n=1 Tax=Gracilariopsis chorda TaxID=448386 RepID=A0A2V3IJY8_9FLOR|nr:Dual specificity phosphatase Cdc25 [Gracilariopsis chorda]|eukprot:PXF41440.1 Dual specificity phosphatase Cdc25 [Gracilariopsis chorda]